MSSIKGIKKVLKNSKDFCTVVGKNGMCVIQYMYYISLSKE